MPPSRRDPRQRRSGSALLGFRWALHGARRPSSPEWTKPRPDAGVVSWLSEIDEDSVFLSVITFAELRHGIERLPTGKRKKQLDEWLKGELPLRFEQRILPVDGAVADEWGRLVARHESLGRPIHAMDAIIGATAQVHVTERSGPPQRDLATKLLDRLSGMHHKRGDFCRIAGEVLVLLAKIRRSRFTQ